MKKLRLLGAMVAAVLVAAAPAFAQVNPQVDQAFSERNNKSGAATPKTETSNTGSNANLCPTVGQDVNTGNVLNQQGVSQYQDRTGDLTFDPSSITITPSGTSDCTQSIKQTVADPKAGAKAAAAPAPGSPASPAPTAGVVGPQLPATGGMTGSASLLGLGAGALLVAGGLIARRIIR
jgi:LPXTG-motif cell wall-anchored protein